MLLALQGFVASLGDNIWILIPLAALAIPIFAIALEPIGKRMRAAERREARQAYERLMMEKLDVLKTAVTMGYNNEELRELDARLEKLVGPDKLKAMLDVDKSVAKYEKALRSSDLATDEVLDALQKGRATSQG
jgi:hypothetical protein